MANQPTDKTNLNQTKFFELMVNDVICKEDVIETVNGKCIRTKGKVTKVTVESNCTVEVRTNLEHISFLELNKIADRLNFAQLCHVWITYEQNKAVVSLIFFSPNCIQTVE